MASDPHQPPRRDSPFQPPLPHWQPVAQPQAPTPEVASVPRRYGPGTLLVITTAYALLFAGFKAIEADQVWWIGTAVFLTGIGIAQVIGGPKNARPASALAGAVLLPVILATTAAYYNGMPADGGVGLLCAALFGGPLGYIGGVLVGGIFLLMGYADAALSRLRGTMPEEGPVEAELPVQADVVDETPREE
jgi:hypothetical protein